MDRRAFLSLAGRTAAAAALASPARAVALPPLRAIGLQLYTVRDLMAESVERTLDVVAGIGYHEVEFAGYFGRSPFAVGRALAASGLSAPAAHVGLEELSNELDRTLAAAAEIGHRYLFVPWIEPSWRTPEGYDRLVDLLASAVDRAAPFGIGIGYHNQVYDTEAIEGRVPLDGMLDRGRAAGIEFELDLFWVAKGGADVLEYLGRWPSAFRAVHVKDMHADGSMADVGSGVLDLATWLREAERVGVEHFFVEHDEPSDARRSITRGHAYLAMLP